jgi:glycosyltransferase involved in cell wall biosynthesis
MPTVIVDGEAGFVDTRVDRLVGAMEQLLGDPVLAHRLGARAREIALDRFGLARFVADWNRAFRDVTGTP